MTAILVQLGVSCGKVLYWHTSGSGPSLDCLRQVADLPLQL
jgi:hypothetical protein